MTKRELAMLLLTVGAIYPTSETWEELEAAWRRTPPPERRRLERQAAKIIKLHTAAQKEREERR